MILEWMNKARQGFYYNKHQLKDQTMCSDTSAPAVSLWVVSATNQGQRIDNFLTTRLKGLPKSRLYRALRSGEVRVNKKRVKENYRLQEGDQIRIPPVRVAKPEATPQASPNFLQLLEESIIFEDNALIIVNKPSGVASHGGSGIKLGIIEAFRQLRPKAKFLELVHRLDRETTGCMILAKKPSVLKELQGLFLVGGIQKTYLALVAGSWDNGQKVRTVSQPLLKNTLSSGERIVKIHSEGKASKTTFKLLEGFAKASLIEASPHTGRTHQIRVHTAYLAHSILGDEKYGDTALNKAFKVKHLLLHSASLQFKLGDQDFYISACLDSEFKRILAQLQAKS
jgi:23S rRNA pseudouridine955/2504/2580 synthase